MIYFLRLKHNEIGTRQMKFPRAPPDTSKNLCVTIISFGNESLKVMFFGNNDIFSAIFDVSIILFFAQTLRGIDHVVCWPVPLQVRNIFSVGFKM